MMKNLYKYILLAAVLITAAACEDHRSDYLDEFQTMVYFRNGGEQSLTLFRTGEDGFYKIPVCKSGRDLEGISTATVMVFDDAQMAMYNISHETSYSLIPASCYSFTDENHNPLSTQDAITLTFDSSDAFQVVYLSLKTVDISKLMDANPDATYVLGLQVFSPGKVSEDINVVILRPDIEVPMISLLSPGVESHRLTSASPVKSTYSNTLSLNMDENRWDFDCTIEVADAAWLTSYNTNNGKNFTLLPAASFDLPSTTVHFDKGVLEVPFQLDIDRTNMDMLTEYALPIVLKSCSKTEFTIDEKKSVFLINVRLDPDQITLTESMVSASQSHSGDGGGAPALVDDDITTFWHSLYSSHDGDPTYGVYIDIALKSPLKAFYLRYCTRHNNSNGVPTHIQVYVSNDATTWTMVGDESTDEMREATTAQWISLSAMKSDTSFSYIRMAIIEAKAGDLRLTGTTNFTALSELQLYGTN